MLHMKFVFDWPSGFIETKMFECGRRMEDNGQREPAYTISSSMSLTIKGSGELTIHYVILYFNSKKFQNAIFHKII